MIMSNKLYDILNKIQRWLPALGVFYVTIAAIWGFPWGDEINKTIMAVAALLAATLEVSTSQYNRMLNATPVGSTDEAEK